MIDDDVTRNLDYADQAASRARPEARPISPWALRGYIKVVLAPFALAALLRLLALVARWLRL